MKCIEDEIPFDVPDGWEWTRIQSIASFIGGYAYKSSKYIENSNNLIIRIGNVKNNDINPSIAKTCISDEYAKETEKYKLMPGDILFTMTGTRGKRDYFYSALVTKTIINNKSLFLNQRVGCLRVLGGNIIPDYLLIALQSSSVLDAIFQTETGNVNQGNIGSTATLNLLVPIPSLKMQKQISSKIIEVEEYISQYERETQDLEKAVSLVKEKILNLAIRGGLIPQDDSDIPARQLLEVIAGEKKNLVKSGKAKKNTKESSIFRGDDNSYYVNIDGEISNITDELPFEIPDTWAWGKLQDIFIVNPKNQLDDNLEVSFIPMPCINDGFSGTHTSETRKWKEIKKGFTHFREGDVVVAKITPCFENRKSAIMSGLINGYGAGTTELHVIRPYTNTILPEYILSVMKSNYFIDLGKQTFSGAVGQQRFSKEFFTGFYFPIPPIEEQKRIISQIRCLFSKLDMIEIALS